MPRRPLALALFTAVLALAALVLPVPAAGAPPQQRNITLDARMFAFEPGRAGTSASA